MSKTTNRRGLALGAIFALVASLFSAVPAQAAQVDGANIAIRAEAGTSFTSLLVDDFSIYAQLKSGITNTNFADGNVYWEVTKTGAMDVLITASNTATVAAIDAAATSESAIVLLAAGEDSITLSASVSGTLGSLTGLSVRAFTTSGIISSSPKVTLTVRVWIDDQGVPNGKWDSDEWFTTQVITLHPTSDIASVMSLTQPSEGDSVVTASARITTALNFEQLSGKFFLAMSSSADIYAVDTTTTSSTKVGSFVTGPVAAARAGVISESFTLGTTVATLSGNASVSAALRYKTGADATTIHEGSLVGSVSSLGATRASLDTLYAQIVTSENATVSAGTVAVRPNQTYTIRVGASTGSVSVSSAVLNVALSGPTLGLPNRYISVNGAAATTSYPAALAVTTGANGFGSFTLMTSGITASEQIVVTVSQGNVSNATLTLVATSPVYKIVNDYDLYSSTPGATVNVGFDVEDQWGVSSPRTDQRIQVTRGGTGFNYGTTVSTVAVVAGKASLAFTPAPATATGSATLTTVLQQYNQDLSIWETVGTAGATVTVNVTSTAAVFSTASKVISKSASISYSVSDGVFIWTDTVTVGATGAGVDVAVSAPGLFIKNVATDATASGALVARSNGSKNVEVQFASNKAGTYTVTYTLGGSSTTSTVVISPAASDSGVAISFDTTSIVSGSTKTITGTLVDREGNPVETVGSASILVTYVGTGIVVGSMPTETDADGEFKFSVLVGSNDSGTALVTAAYYKNGASTAVADVITATQQVTIGAPSTPAPATDQKLTVGSFKGFVAIYALNYTGQKLSAKVAGKWLVVNALSKFQRVVRNTGAGFTIKVDLYIDGAFVRSETVVTK